jgi:hypothetical protein
MFDKALFVVGSALVAASSVSLSGSQTVDLARRLGLSPEVLASAGLGGGGTTQVLQLLAGASEAIAQFNAAESQVGSLIDQIDALSAEMELGSTDELVAQRASLESQLLTARSAVEAARASLINAALAEAGSMVSARVHRLLQNAALPLPLEFRMLDLTPSAASEVASAIKDECRVDREGESGSASSVDASAFLSSYRSDAEYSAASSNLATNVTAVRTAFADFAQ